MQTLILVSDRLERLVLWVGGLAKWLFLPLIAVILFDVVARKIPGASYFIIRTWLVDYVSSTRLQELEWHFHGALLGLVLGYAYVYNAHVRIDLFREKRSFRTKLWIELLGIVLILIPYVILLIYFGWAFLASSFAAGEGSYAMSGLPYRWIIKGIVFFGFSLLLVAGVSVLLRVVVLLFGERPAEPADFDRAVFPAIEKRRQWVETRGADVEG